MAVTRVINKVELIYVAGVISYVRVFETKSLENPQIPNDFIVQDSLVRASPAELTPGEINDLNDLLGNDIFPLVNREDPIS